MKTFFDTLLESPAKSSFAALGTAILGVMITHLVGIQGEAFKIPLPIAIDIVLLAIGVIFSMGMITYSYWKKNQPRAKIEWAKKQGRLICECTEIGIVMLLCPTPRSGATYKLYECPKCKEVALAEQKIVQK